MTDLVLTESFPVLSYSLVEREAGGPQEIITKGKTIFAGTQRSRLTEFFTTSWSWWALTRMDQKGQSQQQVSPLVRVKLTFTCDERMSYDRARGLNWNPLREGIEIDMMTKSDLVIDFMNNGPVSTHIFASSSASAYCNKEGRDVFWFHLMRSIPIQTLHFARLEAFSLFMSVSGKAEF